MFFELITLRQSIAQPGRSVVGGADLLLSFLDGVGEGRRRGLGLRHPGRKGLHVGKSAVSKNFSNNLREVDRRGGKHEIGGDSLSEP